MQTTLRETKMGRSDPDAMASTTGDFSISFPLFIVWTLWIFRSLVLFRGLEWNEVPFSPGSSALVQLGLRRLTHPRLLMIAHLASEVDGGDTVNARPRDRHTKLQGTEL
ncbi:hypothetical protein BDV39DRAFT_180416 [Aspergillus sergii]|uniref:Uncharacterized protein n=1 Tax=Aspergillus sergii TaxID=1034303 RepID=A0A5N6WUN0_9EURO|nr:hypothetical protein BDV39DRAFT_180416 [Aspergillus sergii]